MMAGSYKEERTKNWRERKVFIAPSLNAVKKVKQQKLSDYVYFVMQEADYQLYTASVYEELLLDNKKVSDIDGKVIMLKKGDEKYHLNPTRVR